jgi:hypothetical protein
MAAVIECQSLTKHYRGVTALAGLDLTGPGQAVVYGYEHGLVQPGVAGPSRE